MKDSSPSTIKEVRIHSISTLTFRETFWFLEFPCGESLRPSSGLSESESLFCIYSDSLVLGPRYGACSIPDLSILGASDP